MGARRGTAKAAHKARDDMVSSFVDYSKRATLVQCDMSVEIGWKKTIDCERVDCQQVTGGASSQATAN